MPPFPVRSTRVVHVGGMSKSNLLSQLRHSGVQLNPLAVQLFAHDGFETSAERRPLSITSMSVAELGLSQGGGFDEICSLALAQGYSLCPLELGPHLRLAFSDQHEGFLGQPPSQNCAPPGSVTVASQPISDDEDVPKGFYLRVIEGIPWLRGYRSWSGHIWASTDVFAFVESDSAAFRRTIASTCQTHG
jgi:hypothetical protein